jgi:hypothetical protein
LLWSFEEKTAVVARNLSEGAKIGDPVIRKLSGVTKATSLEGASALTSGLFQTNWEHFD